MKRLPTLTEARELGAVMVIECDSCSTVIDGMTEDWAEMVRSGEMYAGRNVCWQCKEDEDERQD